MVGGSLDHTLIHQVDAFTQRPFSGNPAAVCLLERPAETIWMQAVAQEMNLSETSFLVPRPVPHDQPVSAPPDSRSYDLRWFTPTVEVDLCGHATLASAHILWETGVLPLNLPARFSTRSGWLTARQGAPEAGWIEMDFPAQGAAAIPPPPGLEAALGVRADFVGASRTDLLVEVESETLVRGLEPDFAALRRLGVRGVIVTARTDPASTTGGRAFDFVSRFFAPGAGIDEDPVTGSAHCTLAPYWAAKLGNTQLVGYQASARGGAVRVRLADDRVFLGGQAITVMRGELLTPLHSRSGRDR